MADARPVSRGQAEFQFLKTIVEEIEKGDYKPGSTFRKESELYVNGKFRSMFGQIYSDRFLKAMFRNLRKRYKDFSDMMIKPGLCWDKKNNVVFGDIQLLRTEYKHRYKSGLYYGERNFELMCQVFESGIKFE